MKPSLLTLLAALAAGALTAVSAMAVAGPPQAVPYRVPAKLADAAEVLSPGAIHIDGWLGPRIDANEKNRLLAVDTKPLLDGFHKKPGSHPWIGEHIGKWFHAATLAWVYTGDEALKAKLDANAAELIGCQEPDGYLGTYVPAKRFGQYQGADWDVWSHKYNLIGLLTYYQYTGNEAALQCCRRMADLLINTFPAKKSILAAGTHMGMAATSVLEPVVLLYRLTGDERYLAFARYIVKAWDEEGGPKIAATLLEKGRVDKTANAKAYEMLSNLVGLCELARATGERELLKPAETAWADIVAKRLYITGTASYFEHFHGDDDLPNGPGSHVGETCVTTTWIQLNLQLLRLTGEAKYGTELERAIYNHLAAAQQASNGDWCYYTPLEGTKPYDEGITCCHSSGPRGMALAPLAAYLKTQRDGADALAVDTFENSRATLELGGQSVTVEQAGGFPRRGGSELTLHLAKPAKFAVQVRIPEWSPKLELKAGDAAAKAEGGWTVLPAREWKDGDKITLDFEIGPRYVAGTHTNEGRAALAWGPFVLAVDQALTPGLPTPSALGLTEAQPLLTLREGDPLAFETKVATRKPGEVLTARLATFADAGAGGGNFRVWLRAPGVKPKAVESLLADGKESRSRQGNRNESILDDNPDTCAVTYNGKPAKEDWFAVTLEGPVTIGRVVYLHGRNFKDGGWFDASAGKPRVQIQRSKGGAWETVGELADYPTTTATNNAKLKNGQPFTLKLKEPVRAVGVRVIGTPASGNQPKQAFTSCAELQAFAK